MLHTLMYWRQAWPFLLRSSCIQVINLVRVECDIFVGWEPCQHRKRVTNAAFHNMMALGQCFDGKSMLMNGMPII